MKAINAYILEKLFISNDTINTNDYGHIDALPLGAKKSEEVFDIMSNRYG